MRAADLRNLLEKWPVFGSQWITDRCLVFWLPLGARDFADGLQVEKFGSFIGGHGSRMLKNNKAGIDASFLSIWPQEPYNNAR